MAMQAESLEALEKADILATKHDVLALRQEMGSLASELRSEMAQRFEAFRGELHAGLSSITRQMYLAILGQMAVLLGFAYFFATHLN